MTNLVRNQARLRRELPRFECGGHEDQPARSDNSDKPLVAVMLIVGHEAI
jgi:hypothetical protein